MKKLLIWVVVLSFASISVFGQNPVRVRFTKGANSAFVMATLKNYDSKTVLVVGVKKGQTLHIEQIENETNRRYVTLIITDPNGEAVTDREANCNNNKTIENTLAGDYKIEVIECPKAEAWSGKYKLKFTVN